MVAEFGAAVAPEETAAGPGKSEPHKVAAALVEIRQVLWESQVVAEFVVAPWLAVPHWVSAFARVA